MREDNPLLGNANKLLVIENFLAIPAIWIPGMEEDEWNRELDLNAQRAFLTRRFILDEISPEDFMDGLSDADICPYLALEKWENGISFNMEN